MHSQARTHNFGLNLGARASSDGEKGGECRGDGVSLYIEDDSQRHKSVEQERLTV